MQFLSKQLIVHKILSPHLLKEIIKQVHDNMTISFKFILLHLYANKLKTNSAYI